MSKLNRTVTELQLPSVINLYSNCQSFSAYTNGKHPPCFIEFMNLMNCFNDKNECHSHYRDFLHCLHEQGLGK